MTIAGTRNLSIFLMTLLSISGSIGLASSSAISNSVEGEFLVPISWLTTFSDKPVGPNSGSRDAAILIATRLQRNFEDVTDEVPVSVCPARCSVVRAEISVWFSGLQLCGARGAGLGCE